MKYGLWPEIIHRNLDGFFLVAYGKKSLEEILFKMLPTARNIIIIQGGS